MAGSFLKYLLWCGSRYACRTGRTGRTSRTSRTSRTGRTGFKQATAGCKAPYSRAALANACRLYIGFKQATAGCKAPYSRAALANACRQWQTSEAQLSHRSKKRASPKEEDASSSYIQAKGSAYFTAGAAGAGAGAGVGSGFFTPKTLISFWICSSSARIFC